MRVQPDVPGMLSPAGDAQGSTMTPLFTQPDGVFSPPVQLPFKFFEADNLYKWELVAFCFPCETKGNAERERIVNIKKKLQKSNLTADSSDKVSPRERNALY